MFFFFFFSSRRRHTRFSRDWSSDVCSSDLELWDGGIRLDEQETSDRREATTLELDPSRARSELGWRPCWNLDVGLEKVASWYRSFAAGEDMRIVTLAEISEYEEQARTIGVAAGRTR